MIRSQYEPCGRKQPILIRDRNPLLRRHPVLLSVLLLSCAAVTGSAGIATENIYPVLTLVGVPSIPLCLSIALVLGISGILASIISIIEYIDRHSVQATMFLEQKEQKPC